MSAPLPVSSPVIPAAARNYRETAPDRAEVSGEKETFSSSADLSFMAALLASLVDNRQTFAMAEDGTANDSGTEQPISFGGTFNMDPSLLVLPEGIDAATLAGLIEENAGEFSSELLQALTPGLPNSLPVSVDGESAVIASPAQGDPRLIASGLTPVELQELIAHLKSLANAGKEGNLPALPQAAPVTTVTIVPDRSQEEADPSLLTPIILRKPGVTEAEPSDNKVSQLELPVSATEGAEEFDPLEFRLALKSTRFGQADPYQIQPLAREESTEASAPPSAPATTIKGVMQAGGAGYTGGESKEAGLSSTLLTDDSLLASLPLGSSSFDAMLSLTPLTPTPAQGSGLTNPVLQNVSAVQSHPATQAVAALLADRAKNASSQSQTLAIQLDPPELGRLHLKMKYEKGEPLKVHIVLEKADTLAMFRRDAHALEATLNQAGIQTDSSSLSFSMAQDQNAFEQALASDGGNSGQSWKSSSPETGSEVTAAHTMETGLQLIVDSATGLVHYSLLA